MSEPALRDVEVLIIGAGINGAGLFRDLCEQGVRTVIIDKGDYGAGTSAAPSRLIHGGIKYLETGEFRLVSQSTFERNLLLRNAPHLVKPLRTAIPLFSWMKGIPAAIKTLFGATTAPRSRGALLVKVGLAIYDFYGRRARVMPRHRLWSKRRAKAAFPQLTDRIVALGTYYDATVLAPERLVLELIKDGLSAHKDALAYPYADLDGTDGQSVLFRDREGRAHRVRPKIIINAAGPWIDRVNAKLGLESHLIGGTKGSHIIVDNPDLVAALNGGMIYYEADDGRICLVFDYLGRALIGSTDIRADDPDTVRCQDEELAYFLDSVNQLFPGLSVTRDQVVFSYSGIRPLPASAGTAAGLISRDHSAPIFEPASERHYPVIAMVGGKWTTFRGFAEEVASEVLGRLGRARKRSTRDLPIGGGAHFPMDDPALQDWIEEICDRTGAEAGRAALLLDRYGTTARAIVQAEADTPRLLDDHCGYSEQEIAWVARHEDVTTLLDIVVRRTLIAVMGDLTWDRLVEIARTAAPVLGWDARRTEAELDLTCQYLANRHDVILDAPPEAVRRSAAIHSAAIHSAVDG